jgi:hypothetical protein
MPQFLSNISVTFFVMEHRKFCLNMLSTQIHSCTLFVFNGLLIWGRRTFGPPFIENLSFARILFGISCCYSNVAQKKIDSNKRLMNRSICCHGHEGSLPFACSKLGLGRWLCFRLLALLGLTTRRGGGLVYIWFLCVYSENSPWEHCYVKYLCPRKEIQDPYFDFVVFSAILHHSFVIT